MKAQVTTTQPMFLGGVVASDEELQEAEEFARSMYNKNKQNGDAPVNPNEFFSCYFAGELESMMGFDIVAHIGGDLPPVHDGDIIPVDAVVYGKDKVVDAVMLVGRYINMERLYALVMTIDDAEKFLSKGKLESEMGMVIFNKIVEGV